MKLETKSDLWHDMFAFLHEIDDSFRPMTPIQLTELGASRSRAEDSKQYKLDPYIFREGNQYEISPRNVYKYRTVTCFENKSRFFLLVSNSNHCQTPI